MHRFAKKCLVITMAASLILMPVSVSADPPDETEETADDTQITDGEEDTEEVTDDEDTEPSENTGDGSEEETERTNVSEEETEPDGEMRDDLPDNIMESELNNTGTAQVQSGNGFVLLKAHVHPAIDGQVMFVTFFNTATYDEYSYYLYPYNDYAMTVEMPAGWYLICDGGFPKDVRGYYPIESKSFRVDLAKSTQVEFGIGVRQEDDYAYAGDDTKAEQQIDVATIDENGNVVPPEDSGLQLLDNGQKEVDQIQGTEAVKEEVPKKKSPILTIVSFLFTVLVVGGGIFIVYKVRQD